MNEKEVLKGMEKEMEILEDSVHHLRIHIVKLSMLQKEFGNIFINQLESLNSVKENFRHSVSLLYNILEKHSAKT